MSVSLTRFFFRAPYSAPKTGEIFRWWESRRLTYNLVVLAAGVTSLTTIWVAEFLLDGRKGPIPVGGIIVYGLLANLFYTFGPVVDSWVMRRYGRDYSEIGPMLFRYGFVFAVGLTLLPVPLVLLRVLLSFFF